MNKIDALVAGEIPPGLYRFSSRARPDTLTEELAERGWRCFWLDGGTIDDKASFLRACADAMQFPDYFGRNWDALEECLNDLSWVPADGYVLVYDQVARFVSAEPDEWSIAADIMSGAADSCAKAGTPLYVLLRGTAGLLPELPRF
ncbi:MAG TPA: barstar family protein [Roseiflexaceae bacterium]|nr:barstar family protein [Roseiflexaceae bacterium]